MTDDTPCNICLFSIACGTYIHCYNKTHKTLKPTERTLYKIMILNLYMLTRSNR